MINLQVHQLRSPSEVDHCESGNLLKEKSLEFVLVKNINLSIYTYDRNRKKNDLIYETKLNAPVVKLVILKGVFVRKNKERISGVLLVYKGMHFILYRFNRHLNTLVVVLKHSFVKKANFQPLFYSLPLAVNYLHRYDKGGGSAAGRKIRIVGRKPITGINRRRRFRFSSKRLKGCMPGLHPRLRQGGGLSGEEEVPTKKRKGRGIRRKATLVGGDHSDPPKWDLNSQNVVDDDVYVNLYGDMDRGGDNVQDPFWLDRPFPQEDMNIGSAHQQPFRIIQNVQMKRKKQSSNFCEFIISFSNDFKTIYILFYSSRRRRKKKNGLDPTCAGEVKTTYFGKGLYLFNMVKVSLQDLYRHFIFIKKIFFHGGNIHVLLQNEPINVGNATVEELNLKLLVLRQEDHKFDANKLMKAFPNDTIDLLRVKDLLICLCQDYLYVLNIRKNQRVIYFFKKSCYTNGVLHLQKKETLFCDCTDLNVRFKESSSNMCHRKGKLFILTRRCVLEGTLSRDHNNLVKLIKWRKVYTFKYDLAKSSLCFFGGRVHFVCCYNGLCGRADVDLLVRGRGGRSLARRVRGGRAGVSSRKRKAALPSYPAKREKLLKGEERAGGHPTGESPRDVDVAHDVDLVPASGDSPNAPPPVATPRGDPARATRRVRPNDNFLMDLLIYLNKNPMVNEHTKGLNHTKYDYLFHKYKKKIKILEGNFSLINAQGGIEYVPSLFILKRRKNRREKIRSSLGLGNVSHKKIITIVDKIPAKGMLTDLIKSNEEPSLVNRSSYFALIGNKKYSSVQKIFFRVPFSTLLNVSFGGACTRSVCATEGGTRHRAGQYVMINLEGWTRQEEAGEGGPYNEVGDGRGYGDQNITTDGGAAGNGLIRRSLLLCVGNLNTWGQKKGTRTKMTLLNEHKEGLVVEPTTSGLHVSDVGDKTRETLLSNHRAKFIYTLRGESVQGEPSHEVVEFPPTGTAKANTFRAFFRFYPFVHYSRRDVKRYLEMVYNPGAEHSLEGGNEWDDEQESQRDTPPDAGDSTCCHKQNHITFELKQKCAQFFLMERKKNTHLNMEGNCIALLRFKGLLVQVCREEINVSLYSNTCMVLRRVCVQDAVVECKLVRKFLVLRHESGSCSVYTFHLDAVTNLLHLVHEVTSLLNMCVLRCLDVESGDDEEINLLRFATCVMERAALKGGQEASCPWNSTNTMEENLLSLFQTNTPDMFCAILNSMGGSEVGEILSLYTRLNNVRCISTVKSKAQSLLSFLNDSNCTLHIFHLEKKRTIFVSNPLLAVPKYVYHAKWGKGGICANGAKGEASGGEFLLETYKLEEVINVLLFPLGSNYILIVFLTGRPILIYKSMRQVKSMSRLKFQVVTHRYTQPLLSNVHFVKDPSGENMQVVTASRDKAEMNNGFVLYIDGRKRGRKSGRKKAKTKGDNVTLQTSERKKKKKKKKLSKCIVGYPHVNFSKVDLSHVSGGNLEEQLYKKVRAYNETFPPLLLSNCRGKLFVHRCDEEEQVATEETQPKSIITIDRNAFLRVDARGIRIVSIEEEEKVCAGGPHGGQDSGHHEYQLNRDIARALSEDCPPLEVTCHHSNVDKVQIHNEVFLLKSPLLSKFSFNDDFISKLFLSYPYVCKIAVSQFEYILKRGQKRGQKEDPKEAENKPTAEMEEKTEQETNQPTAPNEQKEPPNREDPTVHKITRGKIICAVVRVKYNEYHCLKKLQKKRLTMQKDELRNNVAYAGEEEVQCVPNVHLQDSINNQYTHKMKGFLCTNDKEEEDGVTRNDEELMRKNNQPICSAKTNAKFSKLLILHECDTKRVYGYYTFEHSEEIHCVSFGCLHGKEHIYVSTSLNIGERVETQGNIYVFDLSGVFPRVGDDPVRDAKEGKEAGEEGEACSPTGKGKKGKLSVYMKKTYNSSVTQIHPFYIHSEGCPNGGLGSALQSILLSRSGDIKHCAKYSGRRENGELLSGEEEVRNTYARSIATGRANRKSKKIDPNVHCNIVHCINSKLFIHEVNENDFTKGAFLDNNFFITDIKVVKNFFIVADLYRGIFINMYNYEHQHDSRSIIPISTPFFSSNLNILSCQYIVLDSLICIIAVDVFNNFLTFSFRNYQSVDTLYIVNFFNFSRRILKYVNAVHPGRRSNSALSISNDGSVHLFHPLSSKSFVFFKETYNIVRKSLFPHLALNAHADLSPDVFTQSARLNLHKRTNSFGIKNVLFDDMLRQLPFYSAQVLQELFFKRANLLEHITIGELLIELSCLNER
ncbi:hypothetical protein AK88_03172 [Plasmodium fragile]|uniref:RSE1/DDB1/CPSF1 C-terminal domain-containing protein n=1 Tax=Plasmodium fragile TaxID=5857 RepID=A0A0D9QN56_PLAFR|nr:uncharacterized protein AK88_03172 [Plasmodium fragile]KJP87126.1 hypothetical protein AK88_03172 [Plasmodium fragile]